MAESLKGKAPTTRGEAFAEWQGLHVWPSLWELWLKARKHTGKETLASAIVECVKQRATEPPIPAQDVEERSTVIIKKIKGMKADILRGFLLEYGCNNKGNAVTMRQTAIDNAELIAKIDLQAERAVRSEEGIEDAGI